MGRNICSSFCSVSLYENVSGEKNNFFSEFLQTPRTMSPVPSADVCIYVLVSRAKLFTGYNHQCLIVYVYIFMHMCVCVCVQSFYDMRGHILQRSTSQGSIGSPIYNRHCYTPTMSRSPQHFHRPGEKRLLPSTGQLHYGYEKDFTLSLKTFFVRMFCYIESNVF